MRRAYDYWQNQPGCFSNRTQTMSSTPYAIPRWWQQELQSLLAALRGTQTALTPHNSRRNTRSSHICGNIHCEIFQICLTNKVSAVMGTDSKETLGFVAKLAHAQANFHTNTHTSHHKGRHSQISAWKILLSTVLVHGKPGKALQRVLLLHLVTCLS